MKRSAFTVLAAAASAAPALAAKKPAVHTLPDGLRYVDLKVGKGPMPKTGQIVTVNYVGKLQNGTVFDASSKHGGAFDFPLGVGKVIKGWDEGVATMRVGGTRVLTIPPSLAYGSRAVGDIIPPNSTLVFTIDLLRVA